MYSSGVYTFVIIIASICHIYGLTEHRHGPGDTYVRRGDTATLHCEVNREGHLHDIVFWYRTSTGEILSQNEHIRPGMRSAMGTYSITGNHPNGEYNLQITNAQPSDADEYRCGWEAEGEGDDDHIWLGAVLRVMVPPNHGYPMCLLLTERSTVGQMTRMSCVSIGGDPPATLIWQRNGVDITAPKTNRNELNYVMEAEDVGATFTCIAETMAMHEMRSCSLQPLRRLPNVLVSPRLGDATIGGSITFACHKRDQKPDDTYIWYFNQNKVLPDPISKTRFSLSDDKKTLTVSEITVTDNEAEIECKVNNGSAILVGARAAISVTSLVNIKNTEPPKVTLNRRQQTMKHPTTGHSNSRNNVAPPTHSNDKIALIAVSMIGGLAIASLAAIFYIYLQRKSQRKPRKHRQSTIPMTPRSSTRTLSSRLSTSFSVSLRSFRRGSSIKKSWRCGRHASHPDLIISSPESYVALNTRSEKHKYQDLKNVASCPTFLHRSLSSSLYTSGSGLPLPPISAQSNVSFCAGSTNSNGSFFHDTSTELSAFSEDEELNDPYETIDEKILKKDSGNNKESGYLEILP